MTPSLLLNHHDQGLLWSPSALASLAADVAQSYQTALAVRQLRQTRGESPRGFKIGFTNRTIWPVYGVYGPVWSTVWNTTLTLSEGSARVSLAHVCQPRLEPEVVFGLHSTPPHGASLDVLFDCIDWMAAGFEIVQSHAPGWKFNAAQAVADSALHARLVVGAKTSVRSVAATTSQLNASLAACQVRLHKNGNLVETGLGSNVLDSPLLALHHFLMELHLCPGAPALLAGDVVTTGTWTDAWPVQAAETWRAEFDAPLAALQVQFE